MCHPSPTHLAEAKTASSGIFTHWTPEEDRHLSDLLGQGLSFAQAARQVGRSRSACIGRHHRLAGTAFVSWTIRETTGQNREAVRQLARASVIAGIKTTFSRGFGRDLLIRALRAEGYSMPVIAEAAGLSRQRVQQILTKEFRT